MGYRKLPVKLACTLSLIALLVGASACKGLDRPDNQDSQDLPVCPGDPRCDGA